MNGANTSVGGFIHSNGSFRINGASFQSGTASIFRNVTNSCNAVYDPSKVNFGAPSPNAPIQETAARDRPRSFTTSEFTCKGMLLFGTHLNGTFSTKEIVLDSDLSGDVHSLSGLLFNPGGGIKVNGTAVTIRNGFLQALWVEINLSGFRMLY